MLDFIYSIIIMFGTGKSATKTICDGRGRRYNHCGNERYIVCKSRGQCQWCSDEWKKQQKKVKVSVKEPYVKPVKEKRLYKLFLEIAAEREHICYVTGKPVNVWIDKDAGILDVNVFSHVCSRGAFPGHDFPLMKNNIVIVQPYIHRLWEHRTESMREQEMWEKKFALHDTLKAHYYMLNKTS